MRKVYHERLAQFVLELILVLVILSLVMLMPTVLTLKSRQETVAHSVGVAEARPVSKEAIDIGKQITSTNSLLKLINVTSTTTPYSKIVDAVLADKTAAITLTHFDWKSSGASVNLAGIAPSRSALLEFVRSLESDPLFPKVDSPISNLIENSNINFTLNLTVKGHAAN